MDLIPDIMTSQILETMGPMAKFFEKLKILAENPEVKEILKDMENKKKEEEKVKLKIVILQSPKRQVSLHV